MSIVAHSFCCFYLRNYVHCCLQLVLLLPNEVCQYFPNNFCFYVPYSFYCCFLNNCPPVVMTTETVPWKVGIGCLCYTQEHKNVREKVLTCQGRNEARQIPTIVICTYTSRASHVFFIVSLQQSRH